MKIQKKWLSLLVIAALMTSTATSFAEAATTPVTATAKVSALEIGQVYEGFKLIKKQWSTEAASTVYQFEHEKNGGKVVYFENNDTHKVFDIIFKTPVKDNTGVNHVLEHGVLAGSAKYPSKSPFMTMAQTSVNTFANALTYSDRTVYPFSSNNDKDFQNLMYVYLDAVFAPKIIQDSRLFQREGWGYDLDPKTGKIGYRGIVFSEMKGTVSNPGSVLSYEFRKNLFPTTSFAYNSGGNPEGIVTLTHKQMADTYKKYYHPSNALVYFYGKMNIKEKLAYLNKEYYSKYSRVATPIDYGQQVPFTETKYAAASYHVDPNTKLEGKTILSVGYGIQNISKKDMFAMKIMINLLSNLGMSPLNYAFSDSGIGNSFDGDLNYNDKAMSVQFNASDSDPDQLDAFEELIDEQLTDIVANGFDKGLIKVSLDSVDLDTKLSELSANRGNTYRGYLEKGYVTYDDPLYFFDIDELVQEIKKDALAGRYFESLIDKYMLKNSHKLVLSVEPKMNYNNVVNRKLNQNLSNYQQSLTPKALSDFKKNLNTFEKWKTEADTAKDLAKLPTLKVSDITYGIRTGKMTESSVAGVPLLMHYGSTNKTAEITYYFDLDALTEEEMRDLSLYIQTFSYMGTKKKNIETFIKETMAETAGISVGSMVVPSSDEYLIKDKKLIVNTFCFETKMTTAMELMNEAVTEHVYDEPTNLAYMLEQNYSNYEYYFANSGDSVAWNELGKDLSPRGSINANSLKGILPYYKNILDHWETEGPKLAERLGRIQKKVFNTNGMVVSIVAENPDMSAIQKNINRLVSVINREKYEEAVLPFSPEKTQTGIVLASQVQYVYKGFNANQTGGKVDGSTLVFAQMMNNDYLYPKIRIEGGAYGGSMFATIDGSVVFSSYRDPGLASTLAVIDQSPKFLKNLKLTQKQLDPYIISILGSYDTPVTLFELASADDLRYLSGRTVSQEEALLKSIAGTDPSDLKAFVELIETGLKSASTVVTGSEAEIQKNKDIFKTIKKSVD